MISLTLTTRTDISKYILIQNYKKKPQNRKVDEKQDRNGGK